MGRMAGAACALVALILLATAKPALSGDVGKGAAAPRTGEPSRGKKAYTLGEVKILGSAEHPGVLFFLPRAKFRLLPYRPETDWKKRILQDDQSIAGE